MSQGGFMGVPVQQPMFQKPLSPPGSRGYKSTMCRFFMEGTCQKGDACTFSHGEEPGAAPPPFKTTMCKFFMEGNCSKGDACTFSHGENIESIMQARAPAPMGSRGSNPCKFYPNCSKGAINQCRFSPCGETYIPQGVGSSGGSMGGSGVAGAGIPGGIGFGGGMFGTPKFLTSDGRPRQKPPCKFWPQGHCSKGSLCPFEHVNGPPAPGMALGGKGNDGKSQSKGSGHLLPRERISEAPFSGTVVDWKGKYGWIEPAEPIDHEAAQKHDGRLFFSMDAIISSAPLQVGTLVEFHIFEDVSGIGAEEVDVIM